jgi:hypothetical protein
MWSPSVLSRRSASLRPSSRRAARVSSSACRLLQLRRPAYWSRRISSAVRDDPARTADALAHAEVVGWMDRLPAVTAVPTRLRAVDRTKKLPERCRVHRLNDRSQPALCLRRQHPSRIEASCNAPRALLRQPGRMAMQTAPALAFMFSLVGIWFLFQFQTVCPRCSGRGRHRSGCPDDHGAQQ